MSVKVSERVWRYSKATGTARLVLLSVADHCANEDGTGAWPSLDRLAKRTRLSPRQVQRMLRRLELAGELRIEERRGRSHLLTVLVRGDARDTPTDPESTALDDTPGVTPATPRDDSEGVKGVSPMTPKPYLSVPVTLKEPSTSEDAALRAAVSSKDGERGTTFEGNDQRGGETAAEVTARYLAAQKRR